jgi:hypothetical protein
MRSMRTVSGFVLIAFEVRRQSLRARAVASTEDPWAFAGIVVVEDMCCSGAPVAACLDADAGIGLDVFHVAGLARSVRKVDPV